MAQANTAACPYQAIQLKVQTDAASVPNTATSAADTDQWRASGLGVGRICVGQNRTSLLRPRTPGLGSLDKNTFFYHKQNPACCRGVAADGVSALR